jgi:CubicO group peptidase (beta-lactamase class C family)
MIENYPKKLLTILLIASSTILFAQNADTLKQVDALFSSWNNATPGMAVAITRNGQLLYNKSYGLADLEHRVPNTTETIFECGSVSKQFTAGIILLLAKEGKLTLSDDVRKYVHELPVYDKPITIQHLLNHTSGLKDWGVVYGLTGWPRASRVYTQELSFDVVFRQRSLNFTPGSQYSYSNSNYVLLVLIAERVAKQPLAQLTYERFFKPLGMMHTQWRDNFREIIPDRAVAYSRSKDGYQQDMPFENVHGPGGLLTTTTDLLRWNQLLETHEIFGDAMSSVRIQKGKLNSGEEIQYAAGLTNASVNGFHEISHSGATAGYRAWLAYYPEKKLSVVILSNDGSFSPVPTGRAIAEIFLGKETLAKKEPTGFITLTETDQKKWPGVYFNEQLANGFTIELKEGKLLLDNKAMLALHADTLFMDGIRYIRAFSGIQLRSPGSSTLYTKVSPPRNDFRELGGLYTSNDAGVTYLLEIKDNSVTITRKPGDVYSLQPLYNDAFRDDDNGFYKFVRNKKGQVSGFEISLPRASRVPFIKSPSK